MDGSLSELRCTLLDFESNKILQNKITEREFGRKIKKMYQEEKKYRSAQDKKAARMDSDNYTIENMRQTRNKINR